MVTIDEVRAFAVTLLAGGLLLQSAHAQRVTGLDISAWQGNISQTTWNLEIWLPSWR